jgi:hypothetical protein
LSKALTRLFPIIGFQIITETSSPEDLPGIERDKQSIRPVEDGGFPPNSNENRKKVALAVFADCGGRQWNGNLGLAAGIGDWEV